MAQKVKATIVRRLRWLLFSSDAASRVVVDVSSWVCFCDDVFSDRGEASFFRESEFDDNNASLLSIIMVRFFVIVAFEESAALAAWFMHCGGLFLLMVGATPTLHTIPLNIFLNRSSY